jgi:hypothetical protein
VNNSGSLSFTEEVQINTGSKVKAGRQAAKTAIVASKNKALVHKFRKHNDEKYIHGLSIVKTIAVYHHYLLR